MNKANFLIIILGLAVANYILVLPSLAQRFGGSSVLWGVIVPIIMFLVYYSFPVLVTGALYAMSLRNKLSYSMLTAGLVYLVVNFVFTIYIFTVYDPAGGQTSLNVFYQKFLQPINIFISSISLIYLVVSVGGGKIKSSAYNTVTKSILAVLAIIVGIVPSVLGTWLTFYNLKGLFDHVNRQYYFRQFYYLSTSLFIVCLGLFFIAAGLFVLLHLKQGVTSWRLGQRVLVFLGLLFVSIFVFMLLGVQQHQQQAQIPCKTHGDCSVLDCRGIGPWYCDRDGSGSCSDRDQVCVCSFACI